MGFSEYLIVINMAVRAATAQACPRLILCDFSGSKLNLPLPFMNGLSRLKHSHGRSTLMAIL